MTEAYAQLARARQESGAAHGETLRNLSVSAEVAGRAIQGIARILRRFGNRLDAQERDELLQVIEEQSAHLAGNVADR